jgi:hypothetical protein
MDINASFFQQELAEMMEKLNIQYIKMSNGSNCTIKHTILIKALNFSESFFLLKRYSLPEDNLLGFS